MSIRCGLLPTFLARAGRPALVIFAGLCTAFVLISSAASYGNTTTTTHTPATYYVNAQARAATNSGTSASAAWKTIAKANAAVQPGDTVILSGSFVQLALAPRHSGTAPAPITYQA